MRRRFLTVIVLIGLLFLVFAPQVVVAETEDLGNGFRDHGVVNQSSKSRGTIATVDAVGRNIVLIWLYDHRGCYGLLMIDAVTGKSEEIPIPFQSRDSPFASILSSSNKLYTHFGSHFVEFDPAKRKFTFWRKTAPRVAMSMTEDDNGVIWSITYPKSGVVSFNPDTRQLTDYGHVYEQDWKQYQRSVAADNRGWIYFGVGNTAGQIIALNPITGNAKPMIPEDERRKGSGYVFRCVNGKVYGQRVKSAEEDWYEFHIGEKKKVGKRICKDRKRFISGTQGLFHRRFPDGKWIRTCNMVKRVLVVENPKTKTQSKLSFAYKSEGSRIMGLAAAPNGTICGGTSYPKHFFSYNTITDSWTNNLAYEQWNTLAWQGDRFFVGAYSGGHLLEWDPSRKWVTTRPGNLASNPLHRIKCAPVIDRPHDLLAHLDGKTIVMAGTPGYGYTGGGLFFWDRETQRGTLIEHTEILPEHSTMSLVSLPSHKLLGGTTTNPGTGGKKKAKEAELYIMDMATKELEWHKAVLPGVQGYTDMCLGPNGFVFGVADRRQFFVFHPEKRSIIYEKDVKSEFGPTSRQQGPRIFITGPNQTIYMLFVKGIARVDPATFNITMLAESPVPIDTGGDFLNGRIYFANGSHVYSYAISEAQK